MTHTSTWKEFGGMKGEIIRLEIAETLASTLTPYQKLDIHRTVTFGLALFLDDQIQSSEQDEFIYHETLVHPALVCHPQPRRVLIAGGGEGCALREVLRHDCAETVVMVDIDAAVVAATREYLASWQCGAFEDPRVELIHDDCRAYLEGVKEPFDTIIVDVTDPLAGGPSYRIFTREFYQLAYDRLTPDGTIGVQAESVDLGVIEGHLAIYRTIAEVFPQVGGCQAHVPSFEESWGFVIATKTVEPGSLSVETVDSILAKRGVTGLRFYDGITHSSLFGPPKYVRTMREQATRIITDDDPYFMIVHTPYGSTGD